MAVFVQTLYRLRAIEGIELSTEFVETFGVFGQPEFITDRIKDCLNRKGLERIDSGRTSRPPMTFNLSPFTFNLQPSTFNLST